ncbi:MAG TPA: hypothetical protein VFI31_03960 [Pirellulales bacterium]|nr:hypothetical protein [Pirellulales bacterium]
MPEVTINSVAAILNRAILPDRGDLSVDAANSILNLQLDGYDLERIHWLAVKNKDGELSEDEEEELAQYRHVGHVLDLMRSKARRSLQLGCK